MNYIKDVKLRNNSMYNMIVEIPKGTNSKFELTENTFDKVEEVRKVYGKYPFYYGCFPQTLADDGDALDCILYTSSKHNSLDIVKVYPVGIIRTVDEGHEDNKILCVEWNSKKLNLSNNSLENIEIPNRIPNIISW